MPSDLKRLQLPWSAAPLAARAFRRYRHRSYGPKTSPLPDFYIGAHAEAEDLSILTSDRGRYQTYFPKVEVIFP